MTDKEISPVRQNEQDADSCGREKRVPGETRPPGGAAGGDSRGRERSERDQCEGGPGDEWVETERLPELAPAECGEGAMTETARTGAAGQLQEGTFGKAVVVSPEEPGGGDGGESRSAEEQGPSLSQRPGSFFIEPDRRRSVFSVIRLSIRKRLTARWASRVGSGRR